MFGSCIIHILYTECAKIKKNNSGAKRLKAFINTKININAVHFLCNYITYVKFNNNLLHNAFYLLINTPTYTPDVKGACLKMANT